MIGNLVERFETVKSNCVVAERKLSELRGRMTSEEEALSFARQYQAKK